MQSNQKKSQKAFCISSGILYACKSGSCRSYCRSWRSSSAEDAEQPKEESKGFFASVQEYFTPANQAPVEVIAEAEEVPPAEDAGQPKEESKGFFASIQEYFAPANEAPAEEVEVIAEAEEVPPAEDAEQPKEESKGFFASVQEYFTPANQLL